MIRSCKHGSKKGGEFLDQLSDYYLVKNDAVPWN